MRLFQDLILSYVDRVWLLYSTSPDFWQVSGVVRTAVTDTHLSDGREVHKNERVVVCVAEANLDVPFRFLNLSLTFADICIALQKKIFGSGPIYNRPVQNAGILGVGCHG